MPPLYHRAPGPIGAAIDGDIYIQVADFIAVDVEYNIIITVKKGKLI